MRRYYATKRANYSYCSLQLLGLYERSSAGGDVQKLSVMNITASKRFIVVRGVAGV